MWWAGTDSNRRQSFQTLFNPKLQLFPGWRKRAKYLQICPTRDNHAAQVGIGELGPHDLRRTAAKLCRSKGGELEQIQFLLGHESILTTERYLGSEQDLKNAVNDALVFE